MVLFEKKSEGPVYECIILPDKTVLAVSVLDTTKRLCLVSFHPLNICTSVHLSWLPGPHLSMASCLCGSV